MFEDRRRERDAEAADEAAFWERHGDILGIGDDEKDLEEKLIEAAPAIIVGQAVGGFTIWRAQCATTCELCAGDINIGDEFTSKWWHGRDVHLHATCQTCRPIKKAPRGRR